MPTADLLFVDHALSARVEAAEAAQIEALARVVAERLPDRGAVALSLAGGCAAYLGPKISVSRAAGLGMTGPVTPADLDALEDLYRSRGSEARVLLSPFADRSLFEILGERGFRLVELDTVLALPLPAGAPSGATAESMTGAKDVRGAGATNVRGAGATNVRGAGATNVRGAGAAGATNTREAGAVEVRRAALEEAAAWVEVSLRGFSGLDEPAPRDRAAIFEAAFHAPSVMYYFVCIDGAVAGTAGLRINGETAHLFAASTHPAARGRGVQAALIEHRLGVARAHGCDLAFTATEAGSASQRNFERRGFRPIYSRAVMTKTFD